MAQRSTVPDGSGAEGSADAWLARLLAGDRAALARALTAVESGGDEAAEVLRAIYPKLGRARVVGVTGAPGAGKSTLVSAYIGELRRRGQRVGVVAVDPSSPLTGGAILGDRIRMTGHSGDENVFVRSLSSGGHLGGLSRTASRAIDVMDAAGCDQVVVETVGAGQSEVEIASIAETKVLVTAPGLGDEIQALKAGILEIADVIVVNKGDLPGARRSAAQLEAMLGYGEAGDGKDWRVPVLRTSALRGEGVGELADAIERHGTWLRAEGSRSSARLDARGRTRRLIASLAAEEMRGRIARAESAALDALCESVLKGEVGFEDAVARALALATKEDKS
ncbi:MAG TPA: methylmalonyl Co-A mutase-associated GTPase MeaB [Alphaproteobacteria bacterium]|nr:methylmalonyl Co-A mutase-associated GTPase MeaB [Alphaproteobacteria bacterium]